MTCSNSSIMWEAKRHTCFSRFQSSALISKYRSLLVNIEDLVETITELEIPV